MTQKGGIWGDNFCYPQVGGFPCQLPINGSLGADNFQSELLYVLYLHVFYVYLHKYAYILSCQL